MKKTGFKIYFIIYAVSLIIALISGTLLKLFATNPQTGFVDVGSFTGDFVLQCLFNLSLLLPITFWFAITIKRRSKHDYPTSYQNITSGVLSAITGVFMIIYTFTAVGRQVIHVGEETYSSAMGNNSDFMSKILLLVVVVTGVMGGFSLIISGSWPKYLVSGKPGAVLGFTPALWQLIVLFARFNNFIAVTTINDILMIILFMCFAAMFLIGQSRIIFGLGIRNGRTYAIPAGLSVSLIGLSFSVPSIISYFVNKRLVYVLEINFAEFCYILFLSLYAIVFVRTFSRSIKVV